MKLDKIFVFLILSTQAIAGTTLTIIQERDTGLTSLQKREQKNGKLTWLCASSFTLMSGIFSLKKVLKACTLLDKITEYKKSYPDGLISFNKESLSISDAKTLAFHHLIKWGALTFSCTLGFFYCLSKKSHNISAYKPLN